MAGDQANIRTFIAPLKGSGRTAPTLIEDVSLYDPQPNVQPGPNLLFDSPLSFLDFPTLASAFAPEACRHVYCLKPRQCQLPPLDDRPSSATVYTVAAVCQKCRIHLALKVDYTVKFKESPCPNVDRMFHHLIRSEWRETSEKNAWLREYPESRGEICTYECSSDLCSAAVTVRLSPPVLTPRGVRLLTDRDLVQERTQQAMAENEGIVGIRQPTPVEVLIDLRAYIRNAWKEDPKYRSIKMTNKRFVVRFGPDGTPCKELLESLGFELEGQFWTVPQPNMHDVEPLRDPMNLFLDNLEAELSCLILSCPPEDRQQAQDGTQLSLASREFARALGCQDYDRYPPSRSNRIDPAMRARSFIGLGVPQDGSDEAVAFAYRAQIQTDETNAPYYLTFLRQIATQRDSEYLQMEVGLETSQGRFDSEALDAAYLYFGLHIRNETVDDDYIIGTFTSRLDDAPKHEREMRDNLRMIGVHRNSTRIVDMADNVMNTYEQALHFLGADASVSDEHIQALFAVKTAENKSYEDQAIKAVKMVAEHRNSDFLMAWVNSGFSTSEIRMDAAEGYQALQIENRTIDDDMIITQYDFAVQENPASTDYYNRALSAIAKERDSPVLKRHLQGTSAEEIPANQGKVDEPVGLENIGNTCYLNSLLQFLFTIVELRKIVLDFDQFRMNPSQENMNKKKVGQRRVTIREVQTAQKFVESLGQLFQGMIDTPQASIKPRQELARLTLETDTVKEKIRRRSTIVNERPSISQLTRPGPSVNGGLTGQPSENAIETVPPTPYDERLALTAENLSAVSQSTGHTIHANGEQLSTKPDDGNSSEDTLVSTPASIHEGIDPATIRKQQQSILDNKENLSPTKELTNITTFEPMTGVQGPLRPSSPSKINSLAGVLEMRGGENESQPIPQTTEFAPPAGKPPAVPPRKPVEPSTTTLEEYARQQDVTEVMGHCLFQLSCAMRPTGADASGEQLDEVHDLFFGEETVHSENEKEVPQPIQFLNVIARMIHEPVDVYAALDSDYDLASDNGSKFKSLSKPPPIFSILLDRVAWDSSKNRAMKLNHHVEVPETIYLDRYLEAPAASEQLQRRYQTWNTKSELSKVSDRRQQLEEKRAGAQDLPSLLDDARYVLEYLQMESPDDGSADSLEVKTETITSLGLLAEQARSELEDLRNRMDGLSQQVKEAFVDMRKHPYRLHAAFFHRGNAGGGHYFVYIYDHKREIWRKYNDDNVTIVQNTNEIFGKPQQDQWGSPPNPYYLVYVRADMIGKLVETVKREIVEQPPPPSSTTEPEPAPNSKNEPNALSRFRDLIGLDMQDSSGSGARSSSGDLDGGNRDEEGDGLAFEPLL